jgi:predicted NACHT family NTPase
MAEQIYPWKRFWCPRGDSINLFDGGYLPDPDSEWGRISNPNVISLDSVAQIPCLILLGEPGIGKSRAMAAEKKDMDLKVKQEEDKTFEFNLRSYGSEDRLARNLFESDEVIAWKKGSHRLYVFLDSLDEGLLRINVLAPLLVEELKKIEKQTLQRLSLRIACRMFDWPQSLETGLQAL